MNTPTDVLTTGQLKVMVPEFGITTIRFLLNQLAPGLVRRSPFLGREPTYLLPKEHLTAFMEKVEIERARRSSNGIRLRPRPPVVRPPDPDQQEIESLRQNIEVLRQNAQRLEGVVNTLLNVFQKILEESTKWHAGRKP